MGHWAPCRQRGRDRQLRRVDRREDRFFNIRFDPSSFSGGEPPPLPQEDEEKVASPAIGRDREISTDEANRFSKAVIAGWPEATETFAHTKALAFFPDSKVTREWFLGIFRLIRGPKNRGKPPKERP